MSRNSKNAILFFVVLLTIPKVNNKFMVIEEKYHTVEEERQMKALELKRENDFLRDEMSQKAKDF